MSPPAWPTVGCPAPTSALPTMALVSLHVCVPCSRASRLLVSAHLSALLSCLSSLSRLFLTSSGSPCFSLICPAQPCLPVCFCGAQSLCSLLATSASAGISTSSLLCPLRLSAESPVSALKLSRTPPSPPSWEIELWEMKLLSLGAGQMLRV